MKRNLHAWLKFSAGLCGLALLILFFSSGVTPPGVCGEVLRHNQECKIDASPLFYSEVENMSELEAGLAELRQKLQVRTPGPPSTRSRAVRTKEK